ncbi:ABC transporter substrate-binding protein [Deinococcus deserti]|uniref:Putative sugar ABC transporter, periplasmic component n=1 Tax=Deinococcus deserti (strain DSM 17065 / CIP 109153 / LMG 22923 / VCD115) TaxID=546414 RepID=C1D3M8_DEIDV|nr:ABC transporter substrate-binding protein [Deinococcus deserti]ACO48107.1 putative sugar ABC transporter, periplasmic component [Deinococcus deserti VCD115]
MHRTLITLSTVLLLGSTASAKTEVTMMYGLGGELGKAIESMIKEFNASQNDVVVRGEFANTYEGVVQKALAGIAAGQPAADILQLEVSYVPRIAESGALANLKTMPGFQKSFDNFWPVFKKQVGRPDGAVYAMPWNNSNPVLYYNPALLKKAGLSKPPRTYTELREASKKIKAATGMSAIALPSFPWVLEGAIWSNGGEMIKDGRLALDQPKAREVIEHWAGFFRDGTAVLQDSNTNADFAAGKVAMVMNSVASRPSLTAAVPFKFGTAPLPYYKKAVVPVGGATLAISKNITKERQAAAWAFINWLAQPQQQFTWIKKSNYVPVTRATSDLAVFRKYMGTSAGLDLGYRQLPFARPRPSSAGYVQGTQEIIKSLDRIFLQNAPVEATLKDLVQRTAPLFKDSK